MKKILSIALGIILLSACQPVTYDTFGTISGTVVDYATGSPIQNASVTLSPSGKNALTGSDGFFQFDELDTDNYKVYAQKEGYDTDSKSVNLHAGETENVTISLKTKK